MKASDLTDFMASEGAMPPNRLVGDAEYSLPTEGWFFGKFSSALRTWFFQLDSTMWRSESNDCDDFARAAATFAQMLHNRSKERPGTALAVGEFWYQSAQGPHAINCAIIKDGEKYQLVFMEPQTQRRIELQEREIASCVGYRF